MAAHSSSDEENIVRSRSNVNRFADVSDDDSDEAESTRKNAYASEPLDEDSDGDRARDEEDDASHDDGDDDSDGDRRESDRNRRPSAASDNESSGADDEDSLPSRAQGPRMKRKAVMRDTATDSLTVLRVPPTINIHETPLDPSKDDVPVSGGLNLMYRLKSGVTEEEVTDAVEQHGPIQALPHIADSNARLVTWSDGSRTLMIGDEHFAVTTDAIPPSCMFIFRGEADVHTYYGKVGKLSNVQPSTLSRQKRKLQVPVTTAAPVRTILRAEENIGEREEAAELSAQHQRMREQARLESKRRKLAERQVAPKPRRMSRADLEDEEESDGELRLEAERRAQREREARLRESKRAAQMQAQAPPVQRRKITARRVVQLDDDDDDDDDE